VDAQFIDVTTFEDNRQFDGLFYRLQSQVEFVEDGVPAPQ